MADIQCWQCICFYCGTFYTRDGWTGSDKNRIIDQECPVCGKINKDLIIKYGFTETLDKFGEGLRAHTNQRGDS